MTLGDLKWDAAGLVTVVVQDRHSGEIRMLAHANLEALQKTLETGEGHFWSRSRQSLWRKGETSGQSQRLVEFLVDCDGDTLLLKIDQTGVACHTGRRSCFFRAVRDGRLETIAEVIVPPDRLYLA